MVRQIRNHVEGAVVRTVIGSASLDQLSFHRNDELNCVVEDATLGRQVKRVLLKNLANSRRVTLESTNGAD